MTSTLKGRVTRAINSLKNELQKIDNKEEQIKERALGKDPALLTELSQDILQLKTVSETCNTTFADLITHILQITDQEKQVIEDQKATEYANADHGLEDTLEKARETINTLTLLHSSLEKAHKRAHTESSTSSPARNDGKLLTPTTEPPPSTFHEEASSSGNQQPPSNELLQPMFSESNPSDSAEPTTIQLVTGPQPRASSVNNGTQAQTHPHMGPQAHAPPMVNGPQATNDLQSFISTDSTRLKLPTFNGKKSDFFRFWSLFKATIDESNLNTTVKLHILLSHLEGDAAQLVSGFTFDPRNYEAAKQTLVERYSSKGSVERRLYEDLFNLRSRRPADFGLLVDRLESILNQMLAYSIDVETESIRMTIESVLPPWVNPHLLQAQLLSEEWTTAALRKTLKKLALISDRQPRNISEVTVIPANERTTSHFKKKPFQPHKSIKPKPTDNQRSRFVKQESRNPTYPKPYCEFHKFTGHWTRDCRKKKELSSNAAPAVPEDLERLPTIQMSTSILEQKEVPLMLIEAPVVNMESGRRVKALIFLDSGAQANFVSQKLASALQLNLHSHNTMKINCFGGAVKTTPCANTTLGVQQLDGSMVSINAKCIDTVVKGLPVISILPDRKLLRECRTPSLLIGNHDMWKFVKGPSSHTIDGFRCIESTLGTLLGGAVDTEQVDNAITAAVGIDHNILDKHIMEWNSLETIGIREPIEIDDDERAWTLLKERITFEDERYQVPLPFKDDNPYMPNNLGLCVKQLVATRKRMLTNARMKDSADSIIQEWLQTGIIEEVPEEEVAHPHGMITVYSPFHLVEKPSSKSTPFRLVHNGSAALKGSPSLNKILCRGPVLLPHLVGVMLRFREEPVVAIADVKKAFLQLGLQKPYRDALRFVYPSDWNLPVNNINLRHFRFCRINFGLICSPFLLAGTFKFHFEQLGELGQEILQDSYVDNLLIRGTSTEEVLSKMNFAIDELKKMGMELSQFSASNPKLKKLWKQDSSDCNFLGVKWNTNHDEINYEFPDLNLKDLTKRTLLSQLCSRFDPLGLTFPMLLPWKLLVQRLWKDSKDWDEPLNADHLHMVKQLDARCPPIKVPRLICSSKEADLVIFMDASKDAFAAIAYLITPGCLPQLVLCKARLAPLKGATIPRLELLSATLGIRLARFIREESSRTITSTTLFGDSMIVLHWILNTNASVPRFNQKRLDEIRSLSDCHFRYVPTQQNPADLATRGCSGTDLVHHDLWWNGPSFLRLSKSEWPQAEIRSKEEPEAETNPVSACPAANVPRTTLVSPERFSTFNSLLSVMMLVLLFLKRRCPSRLSHWNPAEKARIAVIRDAQTRCPPSPDQMKNLRLFQDHNYLWRSKGRIHYSDLDDDTKEPIFLPRNDTLTKLMIQHAHVSCCHGSVSTTLAQLRQSFWIPSGRTIVKRIIKQCTHCRRRNPPPFALPVPPQLPPCRVKESTPFAHCGIDLAGPFQIRLECGDVMKVWITLFTCLASRAIHVEIAHGLSSANLLNCMRKFVARRGRPLTIYTDNGTNFKGALDTVKTWKDDRHEVSYCEDLDIQWNFIPSLSPWAGGVYERMIGLVKQTLRKCIPRKLLTLDEMETFVTEAEAVVNSRPLTYIAEDSTVIRPIDLLCPRIKPGIPLVGTEEIDFDFQETSITYLWNEAKQRVSTFWDVWKTDYLTILRERTKSGLKQPKSLVHRSPKLGEIVLLDEPNVSPSHWRMAKITSLHPGNEGLIRTVEVTTANGRKSRRSIATVHPLEIRTETEPTQNHSADGNQEPGTRSEGKRDPELPNHSYNLRSKKVVFFALCVSLMISLGKATKTDCPPEAEIVYRQHCAQNGYVIGRTADTYCWNHIDCPGGALRILDGFETFANHHCGQSCTCPKWSTGCTFLQTSWNSTDGLLKLDTVRSNPKTPRKKIDDLTTNKLTPVVMTPDKTVHYVHNLDITLSHVVDPPFTCFGSGEPTGDDTYCAYHVCSNGTRFCATNHLEQAMLNTPVGTVPVIAWGTKKIRVLSTTVVDNTTCPVNANCPPQGGIALTLSANCSLQFVELCIQEKCKQFQYLTRKTIYPPRNMMLSNQSYTIKLWRQGREITRHDLSCPAVDICTLIRCTFCLDTIRNISCFLHHLAVGCTYILNLSLTIATALLVYRRYKRHKEQISSDTCQVSFQMNDKDEPTVHLTPQRHARLLEIIPILLLTISGTAACGTATSFQTTSHHCEISNKETSTCYFKDVTVLTLKNDVYTCLVFNDDHQRTVSRVHVEAQFFHRCDRRTMFTTRPIHTITYTERRCPGMGSCTGDFCLNTSSNTSIAEFKQLNHLVGVSRCEQACGGLGCGCLTFGDGCRFSRTVAEFSPLQITVIDCTWEKTAIVTLTEETAVTSRTWQLSLKPGETSNTDGNITVTMLHTEFLRTSPLEKYFASTNLSSFALLSEEELRSAKLFRCGLNSSDCHLDQSLLQCRSADGVVSCLPSDNRPLQATLEKNRLPMYFDKGHYIVINNTIHVRDTGTATLQIDTNGYEATLTTEMSSCTMKENSLIGCFGCHEGATFTYNCQTDFGRHLGEVSCPSTTFTVVCGPGGNRSTLIRLDSSAINEKCQLRCPASVSTFGLHGDLTFLSDDQQWMEEEDHEEISMKTNILKKLFDYLSDTFKSVSYTITVILILAIVIKLVKFCFL